jgi:hypothetical protein
MFEIQQFERFVGKRRSRPIAAGMKEQLVFLRDKAVQAFCAKLCQRLVAMLEVLMGWTPLDCLEV